MVFLGVFIAVLVMVALYVLTMAGYFAVRKRNASSKYLVEVVTVLSVFGLSFLIKLIILLINDHVGFADGFISVLQAVYFSIGGLAFDGVEMGVVGMSFINCLYSGTSLYAGAIFLSVITAKASYDVYSGIRIFMLRFSKEFKQAKVDLYFFNAVTEDTILLAKSINQHHKQELSRDKNAKPCVIIFTGENLETFDRSNQLHREIMAEGFYYWPYLSSENDCKKSVLKRFKLYIDNDFTVNKKAVSSLGRIHVFAFETNSALSGLESVNSAKIFEEIRALAHEYVTGEKVRSIVDFYILTDGAINYSLYTIAVEKTVSELLKSENVTLTDAELEKFKKFYFQLHVINEADISSKHLTECRNRLFVSHFEKTGENLYVKDACIDGDRVYRTMVLGFGRTGQCSLAELTAHVAYVYEDGKSSQFFADVYDPDMKQQAGIYSLAHPLCVGVNMGKSVEAVTKSHLSQASYNRISSLYGKSESELKKLCESMCFPVIAFHYLSAFDYEFIKNLNEEYVDEKGAKKTNKSRYNAIIIALGNDERNIKMANSLLFDIKRNSTATKDKTKMQTIFVNIRSEANYDRILWGESDLLNFPNIKVIPFGNRQEIYSYGRIIDESEEIVHNNAYNTLFKEKNEENNNAQADQSTSNGEENQMKSDNATSNGEQKKEKTPIAKIKEALLKADKKIDYSSDVDKLLSKVTSYLENVATEEWLTLDIWRKQSNGAAKRLKPAYECYIKAGNKLTGDNIYKLAAIEHERWCRFYIMNGWGYKKYTNEEKNFYQSNNYHRCICPMQDLSVDTMLYDLGNIILSKEKST